MQTTRLRQAFIDAWHNVKRDYNQGLIVSERALQAALVHHLRADNDEYEILVEPSSGPVNDGIWVSRSSPDLVVIEAFPQSQNPMIQAVVELKCKPHVRCRQSDLEKDVRKFAKISELGSEFRTYRLNPKSGKDSKIFYAANDQTLFVFAAIAPEACNSVTKKGFETLCEKNPCVLTRTLLLSGMIAGEGSPRFEHSTFPGSCWSD